MTAAAEAAPLLDPADAGRSTPRPGDCTGGTDILFDLRFLGSFSLRNFGCCWAPALLDELELIWDLLLRLPLPLPLLCDWLLDMEPP